MPLQSSGQISLNDLHVEAGGTTGTQASMNDSDIRGLLNAAANSQMTFSGFYGASSAWSTTGTVFYNSGKFGQGAQYTQNLTGGILGSIVDNTVDTLNGAILQIVGEMFVSGSHELWFGIFTRADPFSSPTGTNSPYIWSGGNSGWSTLTFAGVTVSRTSASSFSVLSAGVNREYLLWKFPLTGTYPVTGLTSTNTAFSFSVS